MASETLCPASDREKTCVLKNDHEGDHRAYSGAPWATTAVLEYDWRPESFRKMQGGFMVMVEKFWCAAAVGDDAGWRWSGSRMHPVIGSTAPQSVISDAMSRAAATACAESWLAEQLKAQP